MQVTLTTNITTGDGNTYRVSVTYDQDANMPENTDLAVRELGDDEKEDYVNQSAEALGTDAEDFAFARAFDISLTDPDTGGEVQPASGVKVSIALLDTDVSAADELNLLHFGEEVEKVDYTLNGSAVEFETDGFSVYVITGYTVDFHWGDYIYSIAGESEILLSALLEKLGVTEITAADVTEVSFTNPDYIEIEQLDSDWLLRSRAPFSTDEALTLTLKNGQSVEIKVTDVDYNVYNNSNAVIGSWTLDSEGVLTVTATGAMKDYNNSPWVGGTPWFEYIVKDSTHLDPPVTKIVITGDITRIGTNSFTRTYNLNEIDASNCTSLTTIGGSAFKQQSSGSASNNMTNPKIINFSGCESLTTIETDAFRDCQGIEELDISGTKLKANYITTSGTGFGASTTSLKILKANGCTTDFETLNLGGWNSLQTLEVSGCTNLTSLTVPSGLTTLDVSGSGLTSLDVSACTGLTTLNVSNCANLTELTVPSSVTTLNVSGSGLTTLDISGCENLDLLDLSTCASLTTVKVGDRDDLTDLSWLTLPNSVTTLDASGFTSLTSVDVPASVTSLNISGCTGLIVLDLSQTSLTSIDVSNDTALMALKVSATVTTLNTTGCSENLVIYFDGKRASFPDGLLPESAICWGDCTYEIVRNAEVSLAEIFTACGITAIGSADVESLSASDAEILQITAATEGEAAKVTNLKTFTGTQTLSLTLKNGMSGTISVALAPLPESSELNGFLDENTKYKYAGDDTPHSFTEPAVLKQGDSLQLTLSFSEIPEGQEGERQFRLIDGENATSLTFTIPDDISIEEEIPDVTMSVGDDSFTGSVEKSGNTLNLTWDLAGHSEEAIRAMKTSEDLRFVMPVTVCLTQVPGEADFGNGIKLVSTTSHNPSVSVISQSYKGDGTIEYSAVVEADGDMDYGGAEYPVVINGIVPEAPSEFSFVSGSYTYTRKDGVTIPEGASPTLVEKNAVTYEPTDFSGFPLTVAHMHDGDKITLLYTVKIENARYTGSHQAAAVNAVTIENGENPVNDPGDDTKRFDTITFEYVPLVKSRPDLEGSWASWEIVVNPNGFMLNGRNNLTLTDTFNIILDDQGNVIENQSIDYASIKVTSGVTYDYRGSTGTFVIPDSTPVTITYETRIKAQPGEEVTYGNRAILLDSEAQLVSEAENRFTDTIYPSASDVAGFSGDYMVKLFVYANAQMQQGIPGAQFILLDANQRPITYKTTTEDHEAGEGVTFTTGSDGYANVQLPKTEGEVFIEKNTGYYLEMIKAPAGYAKDNTLYSFMITDDPDYNSDGVWTYYNGDTMKVRLWPEEPSLTVSVRFSGNYSVEKELQDAVEVILEKKNGELWTEVENHFVSEFNNGSLTFNIGKADQPLEIGGIYRLSEKNAKPYEIPETIKFRSTFYLIVGDVNVQTTEPIIFKVVEDAAQESDPDFPVVEKGGNISLVINNQYEECKLELTKMDKNTGLRLGGAVFAAKKSDDDTVVASYTTDFPDPEQGVAGGEIVITGGDKYMSETLYYVVETSAPDGYLLPLKPEKIYFYFCNDPQWEPVLPEGVTSAVNLSETFDSRSIDNQKELLTIPVMKTWQGNKWPLDEDGRQLIDCVVVGLYQTIEGSGDDPVPVERDGEPLTVSLSSAAPYNNDTFTDLPARDDQNSNIIYSIKEEHVWEAGSGKTTDLLENYVQEYGVSDSGVYIVRNKEATTLTVNKKWYNITGQEVTDENILAQQSDVTFDLYRTTEMIPSGMREGGVTWDEMWKFLGNLGLEPERIGLQIGKDDEWATTVRELDKYADGGKIFNYYVLETIPSFGDEIYVPNEAEGSVEIRNKIAPETKALTVAKAALVDDPRPESADREFDFALKLEKGVHPVHPIRDYTVFDDGTTVLRTNWDGMVETWDAVEEEWKPGFKLKPEHDIRLALPVGVTVTVTEAENAQYTVETKTEPDTQGEKKDKNRTFIYDVSDDTGNVTLTYTNTLHVICKVRKTDGTENPYESLSSALKFIRENHDDAYISGVATIEMLEDYPIPDSDVFAIQEEENIVLTTATTDPTVKFHFKTERTEDIDRAIITRNGGGIAHSMLAVEEGGTLTLGKICLDGAKDTFIPEIDGGLVNNAGTLNLGENTKLCNSGVSGMGGAICSTGTVNMTGGEISGNSAQNGSAIYIEAGTLNMSGGGIKGNTGAQDGAVAVYDTRVRINLRGNAIIIDNENDQDKPANLYLGADSNNVINVVAPGLGEGAQIGVWALEGHCEINKQFASTAYGITQNLSCFINDQYAYRAKLKEGTLTNVVWEGLKLTIGKIVPELGANPNDRFTVTLSSELIRSSSYTISGTVDYEITPAKKSNPGTIVLNNVKHGNVISIMPLPVGSYTIAEAETYYAPAFAGVNDEDQRPVEIVNGAFTLTGDSTVTVTNTRRLAPVDLTKKLDDRLTGDDPVNFDFTVKLTEEDGTTPVKDFPLTEDESIKTDASGAASFTMSPTDDDDFGLNFQAPVGATMTITETVNSNYEITVSAETMPAEGEGTAITDEDEANDNVFAFTVTDDGASVTFANKRKMAEIELSKTLEGKVSKTESFTFTLTLENQDGSAVSEYEVYEDKETSIETDENGQAEIPFSFGENETEPKSITLTVPEGTKLTVKETDVNGHADFYDTAYSLKGAEATKGTTATIDSVSDTDKSIAFTNSRKMNTIVVENKVNGYSGNVVPFTYTATVTDGGENQNDYDLYGFTDGVMTFELTDGQTKELTVPYGATLTVAETFIVGYDTTVKRGNTNKGTTLSDEFQVTVDLTLAFTNTQLIGLRLVNNTSSKLENVMVTISNDNTITTKIYRVNVQQTGQEQINEEPNKYATLSIEPGETAILEISHKKNDKRDYTQGYTIAGNGPATGYYYTINNEPSFHEYANPAILRFYNTEGFSVGGSLRYSVQDSIVTFTEQPLVSFDVNGGAWTTEMDGYRDRDGDRKVYQKAVDKGAKVEKPSPDPVYLTEGVAFLGWTTDKTFAEAAHTESDDDIAAKLYNFDTPVNAPITLYAIWARDPNVRTVTVKNGLNEALTITVTLTNGGTTVQDHILFKDTDNPANNITTDADGKASFTLEAGETKNLHVPNGAKLVLKATSGTAYSTDYTDTDSEAGSFTIDSVESDGTISFIGGICKITDSDGNLLYNNTNNKPAVYSTLADAFAAYTGSFYKYVDNSHTTTTAATPAAVKLLVDEYTLPTATAFPNKTMTLTTAGKDDADFPYVGVRDRATIYRSTAGAGANCFTLSTGNITLTKIILDGGSESENAVKIAKIANGGLIFMNNASGILNIEAGTTLRNCAFAAYDTGNQSAGGAISMTNGTLNIHAGLFSNLQARRGGAINVTGGTLNITGTNGSIRFENCRTSATSIDNNGGDGGAIFYSAPKDVTIDGGEDKANPGIIFVCCVAGSNWGDGGAIYAETGTNYTVAVKGCAFTECSAKNTTGKNDEGYGGGAIGVRTVKGLTVSYSAFKSCDTMLSGGAIMANVKVSTASVDSDESTEVNIIDCTIENCSCKGQGGAIAVYHGKNSSATTRIYIKDSVISNCSSGTNNGSGGAIQCYLPRLELENTQITDCWAGKEGGAINHYFGGSYGEVWPNSSLTLTNCTFTRCRAEDRYEPNAVQHYGGGVNSKAKAAVVTGSTFVDCVSTLREGGALHLGGEGGGSTATITGSTFKNCTAKNGGGALLASNESLTISNCYFYGCSSSASNGGAVYHYRNSRDNTTQKYTTITDSTFSADPKDDASAGCSAATNGGAIWTRANTTVTLQNLTIDGCVAGTSGGGVYLDAATRGVTVTGGTITNCQAVSGSAVYVGYSATFSGALNVSKNIVSDINDGAIHGGALYFEGNVKVENNTCSADSAYNHDVLLQNNNETTIYTTSVGLGSEASIGVYVTSAQVNNRGVEGKAFGTWTAGNGNSYLDAFFNDRDGELYGCEMVGDSKIYWGNYICKITDEAGNTLKRTNGRDAIYQRLSQALDEFTSVKTESGETRKAVYIKMLVENYAIRQTSEISNFPDVKVTLTTETNTDTEPVAGKYDGRYPYRGKEGTVCTISRTSGSTQLFKLNTDGAAFQLENITLDGRNDKSTETGNRRLIEAAKGALVINGGTTLQYGAASNGGAIDAAVAAQVTVNGVYDADRKEPTVKFINCTGTGNNKPNGGAIRAVNLNINNSSETIGEFGTAFINCSAYNGGAITSLGTSMEINGVLFDSCHTQSAGGAVYHNNSENNTTTAFKNCAFENCLTSGNNWAHGGAIEARTANLSVEDCSFKNCSATSDGGAVYHGFVDGNNKPSGNREKTTIKNTVFDGCSTSGKDNTYNYGGSVYTQAKTVEIQGDSFTDSTAYNHGGALYCQCSVDGSATTISGTSFERCTVTRTDDGAGGAIYSRGMTLTLQDQDSEKTSINSCIAPRNSGAVHMETSGSTLSIKDTTRISACYAKEGGAIYLKSGVTMNITDSPEFTQNGYTTRQGTLKATEKGSCIYLAEGSTINFSGSPKFSRNRNPSIRVTNGGVSDYQRQDIYLAGYYNVTRAVSIHVAGELTGDTIWVWPEFQPHRHAGNQFATMVSGLRDSTLNKFRNALPDGSEGTECTNGEYLAGVRYPEDTVNVYWDKMYNVSFKKIDNKSVEVVGAEFTLYSGIECRDDQKFATAHSADGETDTSARGDLLDKGVVDFTSIPIGVYYMKETKVPESFRENETIYLVLVGSPALNPPDKTPEPPEGDPARDKWELWYGSGALNVPNAPTLVELVTIASGKYYGIFPLKADRKANLDTNLAADSVGITNMRSDYEAYFMKLDGMEFEGTNKSNPLPGAKFTIYRQVQEGGEPKYFDDGYPVLELWSRDGVHYPDPVEAADGNDSYKDLNGNKLPKGLVYFRELPTGTFYLIESYYPDRDGSQPRQITFYVESDRLFQLEVKGEEGFVLREWQRDGTYKECFKSSDFNQNYRATEKLFVLGNTQAVCKLTDENDKLTDEDDKLLYEQGHEVNGKTMLLPAIYPTLEEGFAAAQTGTFFYADGSSADVDDLKLQMLKDYTLKEAVVYSSSSRKLTFTTALTNATKEDRYVFNTKSTDLSDRTRARIWRGYDADTSADANAGALITLASGADMTLQKIRLIGQKTYFNGRAIHVTEESSLTVKTRTQIEDFIQKAEDGNPGIDLKGGAILLDDNTSLTINGGYNRTAIFENNTVVNSRPADSVDGEGKNNTGADGGAIAVGADCTFSITNARFIGNQASAAAEKKGNGGAISINRTKNADEQAKLPVYNVVFSNNTASYKGGAIRTAENCILTVSNCTFSNNSVSSSGSEGGAIAVLSDKDNRSTLTINNGTTFTNNRAGSSDNNNKTDGYGGAVKIGGYGTLKLDNVTMRRNTATANGGAVTAAPGANVTLTNGTITGNKATTNGGAFYVEGKQEEDGTVTSGSLTVNGGSVTSNTAANGGAVYAANYAAVTVNGGSITGNTAILGSAIYAENGVDAEHTTNVTITNASITGNTASGTDGGAINVGGINAKLHFGSSPFIFDNLSNVENDEQQRNVALNVLMEVDPSRPIKGIINTTADGLSENALIGVYVTDEVFMVHGLPGEPFGIFGDMPDRANPQVFRNDRALALYGTRNENDPSDVAIYWNDVICKLTDTDDKLLYQDVIFTINGKETKYKSPAVYTSIQDGFNAAQGTLYTRSGSTYSEFDSAKAGALKLKMLRDVTLTDQLFVDRDAYGILYEGSRRVTFTTAETTINNDMISAGDFFTFSTTRTGSLAERALIKRNFEALSMLYAMGPQLTLTDIILDGANENNASAALGGIALVSDKAELVIRQGAVLRNSRSTLSGGAVHVASGGTLTMTGGEIIGNSAAYGGAVYVAPNASMTMANEVLNGTVLRGTINGNTATANGAGIYLAHTDKNNYAKLYISGSPYFGGTGTSDASGANPAAAISGPLYVDGVITNGNYLSADLSNATNGQLAYNRARQDIYVAGFEDSGSAARSIVVTGAVDMNPGSLWIWCEQQAHYEMLNQFAVFESAAVKTAIQNAEKLESTMRVFRNAQIDRLTGCGADYLTGQEGDDIDGLKCIYWTGGFDFVFEKIDGNGKALNGATFTLYKANAGGTDILKDENGDRVAYKVSGPGGTKEDATASSKLVAKENAVTIKYSADNETTIRDVDLYGDGLVTFEKIPPATYFLVETTFPTVNGKPYTASQEKYRIVLDGKGLYTITVEKDDDGKATWTKAAITTSFANDGSGSYTRSDNPGQNSVNVFEVMNLSPAERKVILRKVKENSNKYDPISGAEFQIERFDGSLVSSGKDANGDPITTFTSTASGVYFIDKLPYGIYYLQENKPNTVRFTLTVGDDTVTAPGSRDGVVIK